jgi:hypothetical protein
MISTKFEHLTLTAFFMLYVYSPHLGVKNCSPGANNTARTLLLNEAFTFKQDAS